jgi:TPR repeat protein
MGDLCDYLYDFSVCDKLDVLSGFEENEEIMNQLKEDDLLNLAKGLYDTLNQIQQNGCIEMQGQGKSNPMFQLGVMYCSGHGVKKDTEQGEKWFDMAASISSIFTRNIAGLFHVSEDMQNFILAQKWYKRTEIFNDYKYPGDYMLFDRFGFGLLYEYGDGVEQDYQKALEYYTKLANAGLDVGRLRLG